MKAINLISINKTNELVNKKNISIVQIISLFIMNLNKLFIMSLNKDFRPLHIKRTPHHIKAKYPIILNIGHHIKRLRGSY